MISVEEILSVCVTKLGDAKAGEIKQYHLFDDTLLIDYVVVVSALNTIHCKTLVEILDEHIKPLSVDNDELYTHPKVSGDAQSGWVVIDCCSIVFHVLLDDLRDHYQLDAHFEKKTQNVVC